MKPIFFRGSIRAASGFPQAMRNDGQVLMRGRVLVPFLLRPRRVLEGLPREFVAGRMVLFFATLSGNHVGMGCDILHLHCSLILVVS